MPRHAVCARALYSLVAMGCDVTSRCAWVRGTECVVTAELLARGANEEAEEERQRWWVHQGRARAALPPVAGDHELRRRHHHHHRHDHLYHNAASQDSNQERSHAIVRVACARRVRGQPAACSHVRC